MTTPPPPERQSEAQPALADRLEAHTEQMANTSWGLTMQEWNVISNDILLAARTLRAALAPVPDDEVEAVRARHEHCAFTVTKTEWNEREAFNAHTDRATLLRHVDAMGADNERLREALEKLTDCQQLPKVYKYTGTAEVDVESMFDVGHRHKSGKQPRDYLMSWLSMFRPFAYATKDDSWGELEKLISIVMNNYVQILVRAEAARAALSQEGGS